MSMLRVARVVVVVVVGGGGVMSCFMYKFWQISHITLVKNRNTVIIILMIAASPHFSSHYNFGGVILKGIND